MTDDAVVTVERDDDLTVEDGEAPPGLSEPHVGAGGPVVHPPRVQLHRVGSSEGALRERGLGVLKVDVDDFSLIGSTSV